VVTDYTRRLPHRIFLLKRAGKLGLGTAYVDGFRFALGKREFDYVVQMDGDLSHPPSAVPRLLERAATSDVVIGSRYCRGGSTPGWGASRLGLSRIAGWITRIALGIPLADPTGGFKCFTRAVLARIDLGMIRSSGFAFQFEMNYLCTRLGVSMQEVPIDFGARRSGRSKMSSAIVWEALCLVWQLSSAIRLKRSVPAMAPAVAPPAILGPGDSEVAHLVSE
jgi:dolichol-phosphate mannosyltransferase